MLATAPLMLYLGGEFIAFRRLSPVTLGVPGDLLSAGTLPVINILVGLAVAAAFVLIVQEFLEQTLVVRTRSAE